MVSLADWLPSWYSDPTEGKKKLAKEKADKKAWEKYEADWDDPDESPLYTSRRQLPNRNTDKFFDASGNGPTLDYINSAVENPQTPEEFALSFMAGLGEAAGKIPGELYNWFVGDEDKEEPDLKPWLEKYIASGGGSTGRGIGAEASPLVFPNLNGYNIDWDKISKSLENVKSPEFKEEAFNPQIAMANMLMNADWINMDMSKAGKVMQDAFSQRAKNNADVYNANESEKAEKSRWEALKNIELEEMKAKDAYRKAQVALSSWQAQQPQALGGNKMYWRDSSGNLHFQQLDKEGEARSVGTNAAMIEMMDLSEGKLKNMTPKKILQRANAAAMLYPDKDKIPFIQGYILQATSMLPSKE